MSYLRFDDRFYPAPLRQAAESRLGAAAQALADVRSGRCRGGEYTGWFDLPAKRGQAEAKAIAAYAAGLDVYSDTVVVIGIGGSYLGCRAVADALSHPYASFLGRSGRNPKRPVLVYAGNHLSETALVETLDLLEERQPIVNVISKSGTTTEPAVAFRIIRAYMEKRFGKAEAARRIVATTDAKKGALRRLATEAGYRTFEVPDDVGGRYSVLTAVGLVPLALGGFDIEALVVGAAGVFSELTGPDAASHPALRYAALRQAAYAAGFKVELLAASEPRLASLVEWWKQLFGESEGKEGKGVFPAGLIYTTDLHSMGQYVQEGARMLIETFLTVENAASKNDVAVERRLRVPHLADNADELGYLEGKLITEINDAAMLGTKVAHHDGGVPCLGLSLPRLDESALGAIFAFFETACAVSGLMMGVNPFDQPGVEAYKKNLFGLLGKPGWESLGVELRRRL
jgi:glucose-6-phosphate isomerase